MNISAKEWRVGFDIKYEGEYYKLLSFVPNGDVMDVTLVSVRYNTRKNLKLNKDECLERVIYDTAIYEFGYEEGNEMVFITGGFDFVGFPKAWFTTINSLGAGARVEFFLDGDEVVYPYREVRI